MTTSYSILSISIKPMDKISAQRYLIFLKKQDFSRYLMLNITFYPTFMKNC